MPNSRILITILLLCFLLRLGSPTQAQEKTSWLAESIVMSPNGRYLAVLYVTDEWDGSNYVREVWTYRLDDLSSRPRYLVGVNDHHTVVLFSPDSQQISVADRGRLRIFYTDDHSPTVDFANASTERSAHTITLSYSPDGTNIMSISYAWITRNGEMSIWDIATGLRVHAVATHQSQEFHEHPWLSPDWRQFLDWSHTEGVRIHEFDIGQGVGRHLATILDAANAAAFSPDSSLFALATTKGEIHVFRTDTWKLTYIQVLGEDTCGGMYMTLGFGHINPWLVCYGDGWLLVWDIESGEVLLREKPDGSFSHISMDDGILFADYLIHIPVDYVITAWDANNAFQKATYPGFIPQLHPNGELMAAINPDQRVWLWNIKTKQFLKILPMPQL